MALSGPTAGRKQPEVIVFREPGLRIQHKKEGLGDAKKRMESRQKRETSKVLKTYSKQLKSGKALPSSSMEIQLNTDLRKEIFELGASIMDDKQKVKAMKNWQRHHLSAHERLMKRKSENKFVPYPQFMEQQRQQIETELQKQELRVLGDDMIGDPVKKKQREKRGGVPQGLRPSHVSGSKIGKFKGGVLKISKQELKAVGKAKHRR